MPYNAGKRKFEDFDPNASDPNDSDFSASAPAPASSRRRSQKKSTKGGSSRPSKKRQRRRGSDSDDIVDDEDEISEESFTASSEEDEPEINPTTGRAVRSAAKKTTTYEESDEEEELLVEDSEQDVDELSNTPLKRNTRREKDSKDTFIVKLNFTRFDKITTKGRPAAPMPQTRGIAARTTRSRTASKPPITPTFPTGTRRSSRLSSHDPEPTMALSSSGKHAQIHRPGTTSPDQVSLGRLTRGGKGVRATSGGKQPQKNPSAIMEESMGHTDADEEEPYAEGGGDAAHEDDEEEEIPHEVVESVEKRADDDAEMAEEEEQPAAHQSDSEEGPVRRAGRQLRSRAAVQQASQQSKKRGLDASSDYTPENEEAADENISESDDASPRKRRKSTDSGSGGPSRKTRSSQRSRRQSSVPSEDPIDEDELAEEAQELQRSKGRQLRQARKAAEPPIAYESRRRNRGEKPNYKIQSLNDIYAEDEQAIEQAEANVGKRKKNGTGWRPLHEMAGPFGGRGGKPALLGGPEGEGAVGGVESDSSDDEGPHGAHGVGGGIGMTPTTGHAPGLPHAEQGGPSGGGPANMGKITKERKALADADPLGVDETVNFDGVGGLDDHISSLKEMVILPLLYPEIFQNFKITPPRGVLFHGPPGTGKTLLARALANSVSVGGKKVTFYIRKGADALSKWVGEAERQLRLLFEEARKNQPAIIFFDEIDGLAPVRSSKQEQIHASIVATLLALMDGMDGRGQVIVIGATNRPDNVDPALRRPGRFDREFYFPLPDVPGRKAILRINTKNWEPPLAPEVINQLAELTKGYGGADLRALCTEATLNAIQGTYPQIYSSNKKLVIDPTKIKVLAKDFMLSINKIIPSSERSSTGHVEPLKKDVEPLLRRPLEQITTLIEEILPVRSKLTALEEAQFDDRDEHLGFAREQMQRDLDKARVFRPRLLIRGMRGMGQQHLASALLHKFEKLFVQSFDMATLSEESSRTPEAAIVQLFKEVKRHTPSVIYLPNVDVWYETVGHNAVKTFVSLLRSLPPNHPTLVLGVMESDRIDEQPHPDMIRDLFPYSRDSDFMVERPDEPARKEFFDGLISYIRKRPTEFPDPENRKRRKLEVLEEAPEIAPVPVVMTKEQLKKQYKQDRYTLNLLKIEIGKVMDQIKSKYKRFRVSVVPDGAVQYLFDEQDPDVLTSDLTEEQRQQQQMQYPYVKDVDRHGVFGLKEVATGKFYYNLNIEIIETRLSNGYYKRYKDFAADIKRLAKDARTCGDRERTVKANELVSNVEVDMTTFESQYPMLASECEAVYLRELARVETSERTSTAPTAANPLGQGPVPLSITTTEQSGPVILGEPVPGPQPFIQPNTPIRGPAESNGDTTELQTNGSTVPSRHADEDVHMVDSEASTTQHNPSGFMPSTIAQSATSTQQVRNQRAALEKMVPGSQVDDYHNSASTTTSGQKTTSSNRTSGHSNGAGGEQNSNATESRLYPAFDMYGYMSGGSQPLPDTQEQSSAESGHEVFEIPSSQHTSSQSQQFSIPQLPEHARAAAARAAAQGSATVPNTTVPTMHHSNITSILNAPEPEPELVLDHPTLEKFHQVLVQKSSGMSVEQLEQVMSTLMTTIWNGRGKWNRNSVIESLEEAFNRVAGDILAMQHILDPSGNTESQ